jgi:cholesterol transport system auxiliary component
MKRFLLALGAILLSGCMLGGCSVLPAQAAQAQTHDFGPLPVPNAAPTGLVRVDSVSAPAWIDDGAIHYRLLYSDPTSLRGYADHRWVAAPSEMLSLRLQSLLGGAAQGPAQPARLVSVELMEFEQDFSSAKQATVQLTAKVTLRKASDGQVLGEKQLMLSIPSTPDVQGAVTDLSKLAEQAAEQITAWCDEIGR